MSKNIYKISYEVINNKGYKYTHIEERIDVSERDVYLKDNGPNDKNIIHFRIVDVKYYNTLENHIKAINKYTRD